MVSTLRTIYGWGHGFSSESTVLSFENVNSSKTIPICYLKGHMHFKKKKQQTAIIISIKFDLEKASDNKSVPKQYSISTRLT